MFDDRPLKRTLSGLGLEYRIIQIYSRDAGKREAKISFNVGQGTQDLGFRSDVDILFTAEPAVTVVLDVRDDDGRPTMASFIFRDRLGRVYPVAEPPARARLLLPSPGLPPERRDGRRCRRARTRSSSPAGPSTWSRRGRSRSRRPESHRESFTLKRWINLAKLDWFSGDHHVHAAGCATTRARPRGSSPRT